MPSLLLLLLALPSSLGLFPLLLPANPVLFLTPGQLLDLVQGLIDTVFGFPPGRVAALRLRAVAVPNDEHEQASRDKDSLSPPVGFSLVHPALELLFDDDADGFSIYDDVRTLLSFLLFGANLVATILGRFEQSICED